MPGRSSSPSARRALTLPYVLGWVAAAALLGGLAYLVHHRAPDRRGAGAEGEATRSLAVDPAETAALVRRAGGEAQRIERSPASPAGPWTLSWSAHGRALRWASEDVRIRSMLRILATTPLRPIEGVEGGFGDDAVAVEIENRAGDRTALTLGSPLPGGHVAVRVEPPGGEPFVAAAPVSLRDMLAETDLLPWRDPRLLPGVEDRARRIVLDTGVRRLVLERTARGRWSLVEPIVAPAEGSVVAALLGELAELRVDRFRDDAPFDDAAYGLTSPRATVIVEGERVASAAEGVRTVRVVREFRVGEQADVGGRALFVSGSVRDAEAGALGPIVGQLPGERLGSITPAPEAYVRRTAIDAPEPDIAGVRLARGDGGGQALTYERTLDGWRLRRGDGEEAALLTEADAFGLGRLLGLLTRSLATRVEITELPEGAEAATARVTLLVRGPAGPVEAGSALVFFAQGDGGAQQPVLFSDGLLRRYVGEDEAAGANWTLQRVRR